MLQLGVVLFGQFKINDKPAISLSLLGQAHICGRQVFEFSPRGSVLLGFSVSQQFEGFRSIIIPDGHWATPFYVRTPPNVEAVPLSTPRWGAISGFKGSKIFYRKAVLACGGTVWHAIAFEYPAARKREMDSFVIRASHSIDQAENDSCSGPRERD